MLKQVNQKSCPFYADDIVLYELCSGEYYLCSAVFLYKDKTKVVLFFI